MQKNPFDTIPPEAYANAAVIAREAAAEIGSRLEFIALQPKVILDVGCGLGEGSVLLKKCYPDADIIAVDNALPFINYANNRHEKGIEWLGAEADCLPLKEYSVDLIFANLLLPWCADLEKMFQEWRRILKPNGLLMFTSLGPDTCRELNLDPTCLPHFIDMHNIGDLLVQAGFLDPVLDVDTIKLSYSTTDALLKEAQQAGMILGELPANPSVLSITYELVYGHAWSPEKSSHYTANAAGEVRIPITSLKIKR